MATNEEIVPLIQEYNFSYPEFNYDAINHPDSSSKISHIVESEKGSIICALAQSSRLRVKFPRSARLSSDPISFL